VQGGLYLFTTAGGTPDATVYSRMFAPHLDIGVPEDPATGSAAGPLGCYLVNYGLVSGDAAQQILNLQGVAMGRPSRIHIRIAGTREAITKVEIGGESVLVAKGELVI
jgi:trans-2,3-dihydro-3-hydroxyanthranilate isomerase